MVNNVEFTGRIIVSLMLLFTGLFVAFVSLSGDGLTVYSSSNDPFTDSYPPWNVSGSSFDGTENDSGDLTISNSSDGVYTYTSPVEDNGKLVQITSFDYSSSIPRDDQAITLKIYTSDDGFETIENVQSFGLEDGVGSRVVDLPRSKDYRFQVLIDYSDTGTEPALNSLDLSGISIKENHDFTPVFETIIFWILFIAAVLAAVPYGRGGKQ